MCGIAGIFNISEDRVSLDGLKKMASVMRHRGPDGFGFYHDGSIGLAHARLSIIDLAGGWQPIHNENKTIWVTFNGEIFNYIELKRDLEAQGHVFYTMSDTEVIVHMYESYGLECLKYFNGQFSFAIWDKNEQMLFLARDRVGIRPLFYTIADGTFLFASEIKSLMTDRRVKRELDPVAIDQIFTFWVTIPPRTEFRYIRELPAGHFMTVKGGDVKVERYWDPCFSPEYSERPKEEYVEQLIELMIDATRLRLRADVSVGAYLSGGIDSSAITAIIKKYTNNPLRTFSVTFQDEVYDEARYQRHMIEYLNTDHSFIKCSYSDIGQIFPEVIWHTEKPILRTAPSPLYLLSRLVREKGYKVVLTGEGSDEILAGYDIFKEAKIKKFIERYPDSKLRPLILKRLYPYLKYSPTKSVEFSGAFFKRNDSRYPDIYDSHIPRWTTTSMIKNFLSSDLKNELSNYNCIDDIENILSESYKNFDYLERAQYLEIKLLLSGYLLSSQGDRMAMAHSVEGRFPFLDHRLIEFCCKLPSHLKLNVLNEKYLLKESMSHMLPESIIKRVKQPYMAPDSKSFFTGGSLDYVEEVMSDISIKRLGYFDVRKTRKLIDKCRSHRAIGFKDNMAFVGILSTQLLHHLFVENYEDRISDGQSVNQKIYVNS
jgi:asparagine synthase (glutamine-hydrolysing)